MPSAVQVLYVESGGNAEGCGIRAGDIVLRINGAATHPMTHSYTIKQISSAELPIRLRLFRPRQHGALSDSLRLSVPNAGSGDDCVVTHVEPSKPIPAKTGGSKRQRVETQQFEQVTMAYIDCMVSRSLIK